MNFKLDEVIMNTTDGFNPIKTSEAEAALYMEAVEMYLGETFLYFSELSSFIREVPEERVKEYIADKSPGTKRSDIGF